MTTTASDVMTDPMEERVVAALEKAGLYFVRENDERAKALDFFLPEFGVHVEVKQFHSPRIAGQMARVDNVIALQGRKAVELFCSFINQEKTP